MDDANDNKCRIGRNDEISILVGESQMKVGGWAGTGVDNKIYVVTHVTLLLDERDQLQNNGTFYHSLKCHITGLNFMLVHADFKS